MFLCVPWMKSSRFETHFGLTLSKNFSNIGLKFSYHESDPGPTPTICGVFSTSNLTPRLLDRATACLRVNRHRIPPKFPSSVTMIVRLISFYEDVVSQHQVSAGVSSVS